MAGASVKKRGLEGRGARPNKKQKRLQQYDSGSEDGAQADDFKAVDLLNDSDSDDIHNAAADDAPGSEDGSSSADEEAKAPASSQPARKKGKIAPKANSISAAVEREREAKSGAGDGSEADDNGSDGEEGGDSSADDDDDDDDDDEDDDLLGASGTKSKSKRNDPSAFSTSMSKILSTKLPSSRRADPVLARSSAAHENARAAADAALEHKAKRQMRMQKKEAQEKGRVRDVLVASAAAADDETGDPSEESTAQMLEAERRLRKVAQRGVVKLFNAVRAAQVKAAEAERASKKSGAVGHRSKEAKVNEMSKKGFLDLIASGGGALKTGALEEA